MSNIRRILEGTSYMLTRRTHQRTFRLRPCERTNQLYLYCLALAAQKTGVAIHAVCAMSDHHHVSATDVNGNLPIFSRDVLRRMREGDPSWVFMVPPGVALLICQRQLLGYDPVKFEEASQKEAATP